MRLVVKHLKNLREFENFIRVGVSLVDFTAPWCGACHLQEPILAEIADGFSGKAAIASINIDMNQDVAEMMGIRSIPTLIIYKNSRESRRLVGLQSEQDISNALERELGLQA